MDNYNEKLEKNLIDMVKQKENADKRLLFTEAVIGVITLIALIAMGLVLIRIEQVAGYYECAKCHHKYVPTYLSVNMAMHMGRTRYMKCPECK